MKTRQIIIVIVAFVILGGAVVVNKSLSDNKPQKRRKGKPKKVMPTVETIKVSNQEIQAPITVTGKLMSYEKMDVYAEVSGILRKSSNRFREGNRFGAGTILVSIDDQEARLNILSQKSRLLNAITQLLPDLKLDYPEAFQKWQKYIDDFKMEQAIVPLPKTSSTKEKYFILAKNIYDQYYTIKSAEARLRKYNVYAPFTGVVTEASIYPGTLVRNGQKLGEFINPFNFEFEATVSLKDIDLVNIGDQVKLYSEDIGGEWTGRIRRISDKMDAATQTVKVFVGTTGKNLREGMYLKGEINAATIKEAVALSRNLIVNKNQVYVIKAGALALQEVKILRYTGNNVVVQGLKEATLLPKNTVSGAFVGMKVKVADSR
ncbi:efflux RND transporter periplasmic adaptor subunit [uncultured Microscilla sp.]|uniref:efflux RND transporter periplasmic adaptor subunit n=1 Tax=uncultured Microscilla sp. TaxID=432653 RepID=UPI0026292C95|nr:efflux RND transporter periplasmic adaptor subunit [uncultured Microscilla sp.]